MKIAPALLLSILIVSPAFSESRRVTIGSKIDGIRFKDTHFLPRSLGDLGSPRATVLVFVDSTCPLAKRYFPVLQRLESAYRDRGIQFLAVHVDPDVRLVEVAALRVEHALEFPIVKDIDGQCVTALGIERTPEVAVVDASGTLRYRGRIDDQYRMGGSRPAPTRHDLREAIDAILADKDVTVPETVVDGCKINRQVPADDRPTTFSEHVAPILYRHCTECHRPNGGAPFALIDYMDARKKAAAIAEVIRDGQMPPWFASPETDHFANRRIMPADERETVLRWVRRGMPEGDPKRRPALPRYPEARDGWQIGEPDLIISTDEYEIPAEGDVPYRYAILPQVFFNDTWLQGVQIRPDNPNVVHHCNMAYASLSKQFDMQNFVTGYVPGGEALRLSDGIGYKVPRLSVLGLQIHFVTTGKTERCGLKIGLKFANGPVQQQLRFMLFDPQRFEIPPFAPAHTLRARQRFDCDAVGIGLFSHMHLRGRSMSFRSIAPTGKTDTLLTIPNYHFEWQIPYRWPTNGVRFARGTVIECEAIYDNSRFNAFNPAPDKAVRWGEQTRDEMMNGFLFYIDPNEKLGLNVDGRTGRPKP